tara:strand:- start:12 stop:230 length:219 start_codon:yes stop_codon:yes gene_type:complete
MIKTIIKKLEHAIRKLERGISVAQREESRKPRDCERDYIAVIDDYNVLLEEAKDELEKLTGSREPSIPEWPV